MTQNLPPESWPAKRRESGLPCPLHQLPRLLMEETPPPFRVSLKADAENTVSSRQQRTCGGQDWGLSYGCIRTPQHSAWHVGRLQ